MKSEMGNAVHDESLATSTGIQRPPENKHRKITKRKRNDDGEVVILKNQVGSRNRDDDDDDDDDDDKAEIEKKIMALQQIVPGGESLDNIDNLFEETAGYILELQNQVKAMRALANLFQLLEKQKTKLGG